MQNSKHKYMRKKIQDNLYLLDDQNIYGNNIDDIITMYTDQNTENHEQLERLKNNINIDNRKVYYENQATQTFVWINKYLKFIFWILFFILVVIELYTWSKGGNTFSPYLVVGYSIFMLLYPFLMNSVVVCIVYILRNIYNNTPKNVYANL